MKFIQQYSRPLYIILLGALIASIPLSKYVMSMSQMGLLLLWLLDGRIDKKLKAFFTNKLALVLASIFFMHVIGLLYTNDFSYAIKDLRTKVPLILLPLIFTGMPRLTSREFGGLLFVYVLAVFSSTMISTYISVFHDIPDAREISLFISHIRFALNVCFAAFVVYYLYRSAFFKKTYLSALLFAFFLWFSFFLFILESMTGIIIFATILFLFGLYKLVRWKNVYGKMVLGFILLFVLSFSVFYVLRTINELAIPEKVDFSKLDTHTSRGNIYKHDTVNYQVEEGRYAGLYLSFKEMKQAWNERSKYDFWGYDDNQQRIWQTLIRYLNSKELRKDYDGVYALSEKDIRMVESGVANVHYLHSNPVKNRIRQAIIGYMNYKQAGLAKGSSFAQRLELWKASVSIIKKHFLFGSGTGDVPEVFREELKMMKSSLSETGLRSHNQFISIFVAFGLIGFLWFLFCLLYPFSTSPNARSMLYLLFFAIVVFSMFNEDTIESQAGVTFFAFFNAFLLFVQPLKKMDQ